MMETVWTIAHSIPYCLLDYSIDLKDAYSYVPIPWNFVIFPPLSGEKFYSCKFHVYSLQPLGLLHEL